MKRMMAAVAGAAAVLALGAPAVQAAPVKDIYMVKHVQATGDGMYVGEFVILRKSGTQVVGARGAFYSEYFCLRGTAGGGVFSVQKWDEFGNPNGTWTRPWVNGRIKSWSRVNWTTFMKYSGGYKPGKAINYCISAT